MANMSYCRFENTFRAVQDCFNNLDDERLSQTEDYYRKKLAELCQEFSDLAHDLEISNREDSDD